MSAQQIPPSTPCVSIVVDKIWHAHILDTLAYREDCETVFGRFIHSQKLFNCMKSILVNIRTSQLIRQVAVILIMRVMHPLSVLAVHLELASSQAAFRKENEEREEPSLRLNQE